MSVRLVALDEGHDIAFDREMLVVGRHPQCDARLDSIRVSRRHCCMTPDNGELVVKDLGSTNGIRINGQRVEKGRLRPGDELSIAHIRYRLDDGNGQEMTLAESAPNREIDRNGLIGHQGNGKTPDPAFRLRASSSRPMNGDVELPVPKGDEHRLAAAVRDFLPPGTPEKFRIKLVVEMPREPVRPELAEDAEECPPDSSR